MIFDPFSPFSKFCHKHNMKRWGHSGNCTECNKEARFRVYGMDRLDYELMLLEQGDVCRLCERAFVETPQIDHCHTTGRVRGLLCGPCNRGLGSMKDSSAAARNALGYLLRPDADFPWEVFS